MRSVVDLFSGSVEFSGLYLGTKLRNKGDG